MIQAIGPQRNDWSIEIRLTRSWPSNDNNGNLMGMNLILLDAQDYHIQAFVYPVEWALIEHMLQEGNTYSVTNFVVREATAMLRPVPCPWFIIFTHMTIVQPLVLGPLAIPMHKFHLVPLEEIDNLLLSNEEYHNSRSLDIIGVVQDIEPLKRIRTKFGYRNVARFNICDGRISVKVNVWNELIPNLTALLEGDFENPPIVILASVKATTNYGIIQISSLASTKIYINLEYNAVEIFRQRLLAEDNNIPDINS